MLEAGAIVNKNDEVIWWHTPLDRSVIALPDNADLWTKFWDNRSSVGGFAHTHPGKGYPLPSLTDVTTFNAIELGLGTTLYWWILSEDRSIVLYRPRLQVPYELTKLGTCPNWAAELRTKSQYTQEKQP